MLIRSGRIRTLQSQRSKVSAAISFALRRMQTAGELQVLEPSAKSRTRWGRPEENHADSLKVVQLKLRRWISERTQEGQRITIRKARSQWKKQHAKAGGLPPALTELIKEHMRGMALRGEMRPAPEARTLLNLFSGGQSVDAPARASNLSPVHVDILKDYPLGPDRTVSVRTSTDLRLAPENEMVHWVSSREHIDAGALLVTAPAIPCHT